MFPIDFCHIPVSIIKRSAGRSAVAAAAYRSGTKLTNEWDGMTHDYTRKGGIVHAEIMLPAYAPPEFADRSILWNSVEQIEKARDSQLAREIEAALPRELSREQQLALVRSYVKDNFVDKGMCADFAIHDKGTGNPHAHIMLTVRPLKENGQWGAKCRKAYDLDENGQRIPDGKGGWKNHREDTTDWNDKGNVEIWRAAWAAYTNRALESAGRPERIDHRSYKRQGIDKIPSVHLGPAASQMEKRGIRTDKGEVNRQIAADNKLLKEIKARITRLYNWSKAEAEKPEGQQPSMIDLWEAQQQLKRPDTRTGKIRALQESAALFSFLQANGIQSMQQLHEKISDMNTRYYDLRGEIVKAERPFRLMDIDGICHSAFCGRLEALFPGRAILDTTCPGLGLAEPDKSRLFSLLTVHSRPPFPFTFCFLPPVNSGGAVRAVFPPVGAWDESRPADRTAFQVLITENPCFQRPIQR